MTSAMRFSASAAPTLIQQADASAAILATKRNDIWPSSDIHAAPPVLRQQNPSRLCDLAGPRSSCGGGYPGNTWVNGERVANSGSAPPTSVGLGFRRNGTSAADLSSYAPAASS